MTAALTFDNLGSYLGVFLGWLVGFVKYAAVVGAHQCVPQLLYSLQTGILISYEAPKAFTGIESSFYLYDVLANSFLLILHLFGAFSYCQDIVFKTVGPAFNGQEIIVK